MSQIAGSILRSEEDGFPLLTRELLLCRIPTRFTATINCLSMSFSSLLFMICLKVDLASISSSSERWPVSGRPGKTDYYIVKTSLNVDMLCRNGAALTIRLHCRIFNFCATQVRLENFSPGNFLRPFKRASKLRGCKFDTTEERLTR